MKQNKFPHGWDEERVRRVLAYYEEQTEEEAVAEDEAAFEDRTQIVTIYCRVHACLPVGRQAGRRDG